MSAAVILTKDIGGLPYRLTFKFGTMRLFEKELGMTLAEAFPVAGDDGAAPGAVSLDAMSALFWAVLQPAHRISREASDDLVDSAGIEAVGEWIGEGVGRYLGGDAPAAVEQDAAPGEPGAPEKVNRRKG